MSENMMCPAHKGSTPASREGWDRTFGPRGGILDDREVWVEKEDPEDFNEEYQGSFNLHPITKQPETKVFKRSLNQLGSINHFTPDQKPDLPLARKATELEEDLEKTLVVARPKVIMRFSVGWPCL